MLWLLRWFDFCRKDKMALLIILVAAAELSLPVRGDQYVGAVRVRLLELSVAQTG